MLLSSGGEHDGGSFAESPSSGFPAPHRFIAVTRIEVAANTFVDTDSDVPVLASVDKREAQEQMCLPFPTSTVDSLKEVE